MIPLRTPGKPTLEQIAKEVSEFVGDDSSDETYRDYFYQRLYQTSEALQLLMQPAKGRTIHSVTYDGSHTVAMDVTLTVEGQDYFTPSQFMKRSGPIKGTLSQGTAWYNRQNQWVAPHTISYIAHDRTDQYLQVQVTFSVVPPSD